ALRADRTLRVSRLAADLERTTSQIRPGRLRRTLRWSPASPSAGPQAAPPAAFLRGAAGQAGRDSRRPSRSSRRTGSRVRSCSVTGFFAPNRLRNFQPLKRCSNSALTRGPGFIGPVLKVDQRTVTLPTMLG